MSQTASFSLETSKTSFSIGEDFIVSAFVNTDSQETNTVFTRITYTQDKLEFIDSSFTNSTYPSVVERKTAESQIKLTSFATSPYSQNHGLFVNLKFRPIADGEAQITIEPSSKIHANDGKGTNLADPNKLPTTLTLFIGEQRQSVLTQGETLALTTKASQPTEPEDVFPESGTTDYTPCAECPKISPDACQRAFFSLPGTFWWLIIALLLVIILLLATKLRKKKENRGDKSAT